MVCTEEEHKALVKTVGYVSSGDNKRDRSRKERVTMKSRKVDLTEDDSTQESEQHVYHDYHHRCIVACR